MQDPEADEDVKHTGTIIWNYYKIDGAQSKNGGATNVTCTFCDTSFSGSRAFAHILGKAVLSQKRPNIGGWVTNHKDDDSLYAQFKIAQNVLNKEILANERQPSSSQAKQSVWTRHRQKTKL